MENRSEWDTNSPQQAENPWDSLARGPEEQDIIADNQELVDETNADETTPVAAESGAPIQKITRAEWLEQNRPEIQKEITYYAGEMRDTNAFFKSYLLRLKNEGRELSSKDFRKLEEEYALYYMRVQDNIRRCAWDDHSQASAEAIAEATSPMIAGNERDQGETIEAVAGKFYQERSEELVKAIEASDDPAKETDMRILRTFYSSVAEHLECKYMTPSEIDDEYGRDPIGFKRYDEYRTRVHNDAIKHFNQLNDLARKYGTTPFMARDLWTSENQRQTPAMSSRMSYDRHLFEHYYAWAFSELNQRIKRKHERNNW